MVNRFKDAFKTPSRTSPKGGSRGCLCADNTYSVECCDGSLMAQGIGIIYKKGEPKSIAEIVLEFKGRVLVTGGTFENEQGLIDILTTLNNT